MRLPVRILVLLVFAVETLPASASTTIRSDGLLDVDGEVMFPLGLMNLGLHTYADWNERIRASGVNFVWDLTAAHSRTPPRCSSVADSARSGGYRLLVGSYDTIAWDNPETPYHDVVAPMYAPDELASLRVCFDDEPGTLLGFVNRDEPAWTLAQGWIGDVDAQHIIDTYDQVHAVFPDVPIAMNFAPAHASGDIGEWRAALDPFIGATDIVMHACYPFPAGPGTCTHVNALGWPDCSMDRLPENADRFLTGVVHPGQPLWMIVQAYKGIPRKEARWEAYASIVHGATGLMWAGWTWFSVHGDGADNWPVISEVTREVSGLHEFLVGPDVTGVASEHPDVEVRAKRSGDEIVVFAIARRGYRGPAGIRLPQAARTPVVVYGEGRTLESRQGRIEDKFDGYEAHVYRYESRRTSLAGVDRGRFRLSVVTPRKNGRVAIRLVLPARATVTITAHDVRGRRVALAGSGTWDEGVVDESWNGRSFDGTRIAPGVYFLRAVTSEGEVATTKLVVAH